MIDYKQELENQYQSLLSRQNDLTPYGQVLSDLTAQCSSVVEMGIGPLQYGLNSTWALLHGLHTSTLPGAKKYTSIDMEDNPVNSNIYHAKEVGLNLGIDFNFILADSGTVDIEEYDLLFIDTEHTYQHLVKELNRHSGKIQKYIAIHDTSGTYEFWEDWPSHHERRGVLKDFPEKYGMWRGVVDFLEENKDWTLYKRHEENYGMTILSRV
jgi:hypothetical protein